MEIILNCKSYAANLQPDRLTVVDMGLDSVELNIGDITVFVDRRELIQLLAAVAKGGEDNA